MRTPLCRDVGYLRAGRALVQPIDELLQFLPFALGFDFNTAVEQVPYSSAQAESRCLLKDKPPVEHALYNPGDYGVERCSFRLVCHK